ncbi:MAG: hypothetical protein L0216_12120, partial [Planctomycetales bacterium]|nr:hypothetical protein [Planctomycetales bacterium]
ILEVRSVETFDPAAWAAATFGTSDPRHPGVARAREMGDRIVVGPVSVFAPAPVRAGSALTPAETRFAFSERGHRTVAGFQTRNAPHRGHESLHKMALALCDGLLVHPVVGPKKPGDLTDAALVAGYEAALARYYPRDRTLLAVLPLPMAYAGPREAVHHAIIRRNHGCTHFIVGRDHAGVGGFYPPEAAIEAIGRFPDLGIVALPLRGDFFHCRACGETASDRTCPHAETERLAFSGTRVREWLRGGQVPPEAMRPEVVAAIRATGDPFVA